MAGKQREIRRVDVLSAISDLERVLDGNEEALQKLSMIRQKVDDLSIVVYAAASAGEAIAVIQDTDEGRGVHTLVTNGYKELVGLENDELAKTPWAQIVHKDDVTKLMEHYRNRFEDPSVPALCEARIVSRTKGTVDVAVNVGKGEYGGKPAYVIFLRDISLRNEYARRSKLVEKFRFAMEAVREISHDLGNMSMSLQMVDTYRPADFSEENWATVQRSADQIMNLVKRLTDFSGQKFSETVDYVDAATLANDVAHMVRCDYEHAGISFYHHFDEGCSVYVQPIELKRALHNLLVNAGEAVDEAEQMNPQGWDGRKEVRFTGKRERDCVVIEIADTGIGIEGEISRIYLPRFSTKSKGRPSGIGLGMVYSTVVQNGGHIWHSSEGLGKGATCTIKLPYRPGRKT